MYREDLQNSNVAMFEGENDEAWREMICMSFAQCPHSPLMRMRVLASSSPLSDHKNFTGMFQSTVELSGKLSNDN